jgi:DNA-binding transcriptional ArsR family regulator
MQKQFVHHQSMPAEPDLSRLARTLGDPTRIRMLTLLMDGRALTAKELAYGAGVEPATGTAHLQKLLAESLVISRTQRRHKYFNLSSANVTRCIESLMLVAKPREETAQVSLPPIRLARFCYDHLAGRVATQIIDVLKARRILDIQERVVTVTPKGERWLMNFGLDLSAIANSRRQFAVPCLDWSERRDHLGGALGAALAERMLSEEWLKRKDDSRVASITRRGAVAFRNHFGVSLG